ncbi:heme exporter protein D [Pararhizobium capsulatum DSM 1112]|uniref:Heme exporter protein D n=1 Tax=Pararhizobium capsulatum DSM 1112 TaxID=1121113 RepID=A0ABU0BK29_9HYPH|nr:heme exporter protein CcmD [Pararhizobium capsulatum]MDQ0318036.1 heme exporter protein D [Pararhizobium capsulatum DSM 1112]
MSGHLAYVAASYGAATILILALIGWVFLDGRARRRELKTLEDAGIRRRSEGKPTS